MLLYAFATFGIAVRGKASRAFTYIVTLLQIYVNTYKDIYSNENCDLTFNKSVTTISAQIQESKYKIERLNFWAIIFKTRNFTSWKTQDPTYSATHNCILKLNILIAHS